MSLNPSNIHNDDTHTKESDDDDRDFLLQTHTLRSKYLHCHFESISLVFFSF